MTPGASRGIGVETVKAALEAGHSVRALSRSVRRITVAHPKLEKMAGDALEMVTVKRALTGTKATEMLAPCVVIDPSAFRRSRSAKASRAQQE
jgi:NAD(P)-dependent dehydrogenase (short-subunit alcohol dehydrogenase family)